MKARHILLPWPLLQSDGFHVSLWQLPYFAPKNKLFSEIIEKGLAVRDANGNLPEEDAVPDFSNPATVAWYQNKIASLLKLGVAAIKVDFGEAATLNGFYASCAADFTSTIIIRCATTKVFRESNVDHRRARNTMRTVIRSWLVLVMANSQAAARPVSVKSCGQSLAVKLHPKSFGTLRFAAPLTLK